jgi:5'-deoxynucleotidase YfbR-like HD superfamily hydrolase
MSIRKSLICSRCKLEKSSDDFSSDSAWTCKTCKKEYDEGRRHYKRYRLSEEEWLQLFEKQGKKCAICGSADPKSKVGWHTDHDHSCCPGEQSCGVCVRGIVCRDCNLVLGFANDNLTTLANASSYLQNNPFNISRAWIETYTGKKFYLLSPRIEDVDIKDIAHALSLLCRWTGHCKYHYSIAQHSYYCSLLGPEEEALYRLLHDASEAFMGDMNRPLKHFTPAGFIYRKQEKVVQEIIYQSFGLDAKEPSSVHVADNQMLYAEKKQIMSELAWDTDWTFGQGAEDLGVAGIAIEEWTPEKAETMFLKRFEELYNRRIN